MRNLSFNYFNRIEEPTFVLCNINKSKLGALRVCERKITPKVNDMWEIQFKIYRYYDNKLNSLYDKVEQMKLVFLPGIGYFKIKDCSINSEGEVLEYKDVVAWSNECSFGDKYLESFVINMGTVNSIDGVKLFSLSNPSGSLLHLILEKFPNWTIGHVDLDLQGLERSFEIDKQDVYSFMMEDMSTAFECEFDFDTINNIINVYKADTTVADPKLLISYHNFLQNAKITPESNTIKTCLTLLGNDDLTVREVNMGSDKIYNFDYYHSLDWMSQSLYRAIDAWTEKYNSLVPQYTEVSERYMALINQKYYLTNEMLPESPDSTDYTEYCLNELEVLKKQCENTEDVLRRNNNDQYHEDPNSVYQQMYLPNHNKLTEINAEITVRKEQIAVVDTDMETVRAELAEIAEEASLEYNLSEDNIKELSCFIMEDTLTDTNFLTTDTMTDAEVIQAKKEFVEHGKKELAKVAQPQYQITASLVDLFNIPVFLDRVNGLEVGSYLYMKLRDDYVLKLRVLSYTYDFETKETDVTFGNVNRHKDKNIFDDVTEAINTATSAANTLSFNLANLKRGASTANEVDQMIDAGLVNAGKAIKDTYSTAEWNDRGLYLNATPDSAFPDDSVFLGAGQIKFSADGWKTCETALGRINVNGTSTFGLIAKMVVGGAIVGGTITGSAIDGGIITGGEIIGGTLTGSAINNGNGTFSVDETGKMKCTNADIEGVVDAKEGSIGDFNIQGSVLKSSVMSIDAAGNLELGDPEDGYASLNAETLYMSTGRGTASVQATGIHLDSEQGTIGITPEILYIGTPTGELIEHSAALVQGGLRLTYDEYVGMIDINPSNYNMTFNISGISNPIYNFTGDVKAGKFLMPCGSNTGRIYADSKYNGLVMQVVGPSGGSIVGDHLVVGNIDISGGATIAGGDLGVNGDIIGLQGLGVTGNALISGGAQVKGQLRADGAFYVNKYIRGIYDNSSYSVTICTNYGLYVQNYDNSAPQEVFASKFTTHSSEKYKTDIQEAGDVRDIITNSTIFNYKRISDKKDPVTEYGLILERNCPEALINDSREGVDTYTMLSILWKDHQRLIQEYEELQRRVEILENK